MTVVGVTERIKGVVISGAAEVVFVCRSAVVWLISGAIVDKNSSLIDTEVAVVVVVNHFSFVSIFSPLLGDDVDTTNLSVGELSVFSIVVGGANVVTTIVRSVAFRGVGIVGAAHVADSPAKRRKMTPAA